MSGVMRTSRRWASGWPHDARPAPTGLAGSRRRCWALATAWLVGLVVQVVAYAFPRRAVQPHAEGRTEVRGLEAWSEAPPPCPR